MTPALDIHARAGMVVVTMTPDAAHRIGAIIGEHAWPEAGPALIAAANHADYTVPYHFVPREGSAPFPRFDGETTSDARFSPGDGPRMTVGDDGPAYVHAPDGAA